VAGEKVLVVDDSRVYRDLVVNHILTPNGFEALAAADGEEGLRIARSESPDLIVLDMLMPGLTGIQVLEALHAEGRDIPVILMTIHGSEEVAVRAFRLGAKDYVIKPFDVEELLDAMERALSEIRLRRERDALMRQLEAQHRQLQAVLANTEDAVILVREGEESRVMLANDAACQAFDIGGDAVDQPLREIVDDQILLQLFHSAGASGQVAHAEIPLADGRTLNANVTPIPEVGRVAVLQDITHLKELDRMKSEFVTTVSHDLRSPLTTIKGFADLMPVAGPLNEQQGAFLSKIQGAVGHVTQMVTDLLDLGRIEAEVNLGMEPCDMSSIIERVVESQHPGAVLKGQTLEWRAEMEFPPVLGNELRLAQAVTNLVNNAIKYTPEGGQITVSGTVQDGHLAVSVEDNGIGIPPADRPYIFDKFYRVKTAETDDIVGTGLGLSIVKSIIEKHHGRIWVRSHLGVGTTFTFMLPVASEAATSKS
jgi:two-component system phosphate regulon sensor histidine kinase PhoR